MKQALIFNNTSVVGHYGCTAVMLNLVEKIKQNEIKPVLLCGTLL